MEPRWWPCPACETPVPFTYQIEESFGHDGRAQFDPAGCIGPKSDQASLAACWLRVIRCPNDECGEAWALTLYPASKSLFDDRSVAYPS